MAPLMCGWKHSKVVDEIYLHTLRGEKKIYSFKGSQRGVVTILENSKPQIESVIIGILIHNGIFGTELLN